MSISINKIKRWTLMLSGKSIYHVKQGIGKNIQRNTCKGYYNDLTNKVLLGQNDLDQNGIPLLTHSDGRKVYMPTMIFQYGLGAFDLWIETEKDVYFQMAVKCADWAIANQLSNGAWNTFFYVYPDHPYSAMPQGEGASLLLRVYNQKKESRYFQAAHRAIDFMLCDVKIGGVSSYDDGLTMLEYTNSSAILNGWIFALWGLYDYCFVDKTDRYTNALELTIKTLKKKLHLYDNGYWSLYNLDGMITSSFYHELHIAQLETMHMLFGDEMFENYAKVFSKYNRNVLNRTMAFVVKAIQKLREKE